jgi:oligopeptidase B
MLARIKESDLSVPYRKGRYWYYARTEEGKQYPILARKLDALTAPRTSFSTLNALARILRTSRWRVRRQRRRRRPRLHRRHDRIPRVHACGSRTSAGSGRPESIERVSSGRLGADGSTLFYVTDDHAKRPHRLWRHRRATTARSSSTMSPTSAFSLTIRGPQSRLSVPGRRQPHGERGPLSRRGTPEGALRVFLPRAPSSSTRSTTAGGISGSVPTIAAAIIGSLAAIGSIDKGAWTEVLPHRAPSTWPGSSRSPRISSPTSGRVGSSDSSCTI